jgi:crossover junction endodeoxyribonuclease RusA
MIEFSLPWPPKILSPNARAHWAPRSRATKSYRVGARILAQHAARGADITIPLKIEFTFCPPDNRRRDQANLLGHMKAGIDGIADALVIDDRHFHVGGSIGPATEGGDVRVRLTWAPS